MAPPDHRRINGPETSFDYKIYSAESTLKKPPKHRIDGRVQTTDHRSLCKPFCSNIHLIILSLL
jgi:hypothetical protein